MSNIPTAHNGCKNKEDIAKVVLMPGDPLRAKYIADNYLENVIQFTQVRGILGYTGYYKGKRISVMASGMGMPSIGIYSYELFNFYDVETIVRIGSSGSYDESLKLYDVILVEDAYSDTNFAKVTFGMGSKIMKPTKTVMNKLEKFASELNIPVKKVRVYSSDCFYSTNPDRWKKIKAEKGCMAVEMESFALFAAAKAFNKKAAAILTISDSLVTGEETTSLEREKNFNDMIKIALKLAKN